MTIDTAWVAPFQTIAEQAAKNAAEAFRVRRELGLDPAPIKPPFWIEVCDHKGGVYTVSAGGDRREAERKRSQQAFDSPGYKVTLTDSNGKALS